MNTDNTPQELRKKIDELKKAEMLMLRKGNYVKHQELMRLRQQVEEVYLDKQRKEEDFDYLGKNPKEMVELLRNMCTIGAMIDIANGYLMEARQKWLKANNGRPVTGAVNMLNRMDEVVKNLNTFITDLADSDGEHYSEAYSEFVERIEECPELMALRNRVSKLVQDYIKNNQD